MNLLVPIFFAIYSLTLQTSMAAMEIGSWILFTLFLVQFAQARFPWKEIKTGIEIPLSLFFLSVLIGALRSYGTVPLHETIDTVGWTRWILLVYAYVFLLRQHLKLSWEKGHYWWLGLSIVVSAYAFMQFQWGIELVRRHEDLDVLGNHWRAMGFFNLCLTFAYEIGMVGATALALAMIHARLGNTKKALFAGAAYLAVTIAVVASLTRGAWLSYAAASAVIVLIFSPRKGVPIIFGALLTTAFMIWKVPALNERFMSIFNPTTDSSNSVRLLIWKTNWLIFLDHPIFGVGLGQNTILSPEYYARLGHPEVTFYSHSHNNILEFLSCTGAVGTIAYLWISLFFGYTAWKLYREAGYDHAWFKAIGLGSLGAQIHFQLGGLTECNFVDAEVNHTLIFIWAITLGAYTILKKPRPKTLEHAH